MKKYKKPYVVNSIGKNNVVPAAIGAAALSVGGAFAAGVASGLMKDNKFFTNKVPSIKKVIVV